MKIYCDASDREACYIVEGEKPVVTPFRHYLSVNRAEYESILIALRTLDTLPRWNPVEVYTDSQFVARQFQGVYRCRDKGLMPLLTELRALACKINLTVNWIEREKNPAGFELEKIKKERKKNGIRIKE